MRINWDEIPEGGLFLTIDDFSWVPDNEFVCQGQGECDVSLKKKGGRVLLAGSMRLPLLLECDRCLDSFTHTLAEEFEVFFELVVVDEEKAGVVSEYFYQSNVPDVVFLNEPVVDVYSVLAEQLYLGLPEKSLCSDNCLGICPECGANLNRGPCDCSRGAAASPFSVLMRLKEQ
jgi:uncharacterized protein